MGTGSVTMIPDYAEEKAMEGSFRTQESDVTRVVHSGLIMRPIYELEMRRFRSGDGGEKVGAWEVVDVMWLAFAILDTISELTEYHMGATRSEVIDRVLPIAGKQAVYGDADVNEEELREVLNKIFDHLVNRDNRYLPFEYRYFDGSSRSFQIRKFWLIKAVYTGQGKKSLFTLTDEGYAAYFGLHETSALDATAIGNLRIKLFIERGNVDDAIAVAEQNQKQCLRKAHEIRNTRRAIQRHIHSVEFNRINAMADEGAGQAVQIQQESSRLQNLVSENLADTLDEELEIKLQYLGRQLKTLNGRQMDLVGELQQLPEDYHKNSHKLFRRTSPGILPAPDEVLKRVSRMEEGQAARIGREFIARFDPPIRPVLYDPASMIDAIERGLERVDPSGEKQQTVQEVDGDPIETYKSELTEALMGHAFAALENSVRMAENQTLTLEEALEKATRGGTDQQLPIAVAMAVFQCVVDRRMADRNQIRVERSKPESWFAISLPGDRIYRGHKLIITSSHGT